jgi:hypothetical protein
MPGIEPTTFGVSLWYSTNVPHLPYTKSLKLNIFSAKYLPDDVSSNVFTLVCILLHFFTEKIDSFQLE